MSIMVPQKCFSVLIESGAAHGFVDEKVIQGNFAKSCTPFREFSLQIHTSIRELFVQKHTQTWAHPRTAHNGGEPPG